MRYPVLQTTAATLLSLAGSLAAYGQTTRPSTTQPTTTQPGTTQPTQPGRPGEAQPRTLDPGRATTPGTTQPGGTSPGQNDPGRLDPNNPNRPGTPGTPGNTGNPGNTMAPNDSTRGINQDRNGTIDPATGQPRRPGDRLNDPMNPNRSSMDRWERPFSFQSPEMERRFNENSRRLVDLERRMGDQNKETLRRLGQVRQMSGPQQNAAMFDLMQQMIQDQQRLQEYLVQARTGWTGELDNTDDSSLTPRRGTEPAQPTRDSQNSRNPRTSPPGSTNPATPGR